MMKLWLVMHDAYDDLLVFAQDDVTAAKIWHSFYELPPSSLRSVKCFELPGEHNGVRTSRALAWDDLRFSEVLGSQLMNYSLN